MIKKREHPQQFSCFETFLLNDAEGYLPRCDYCLLVIPDNTWYYVVHRLKSLFVIFYVLRKWNVHIIRIHKDARMFYCRRHVLKIRNHFTSVYKCCVELNIDI